MSGAQSSLFNFEMSGAHASLSGKLRASKGEVLTPTLTLQTFANNFLINYYVFSCFTYTEENGENVDFNS